MESFLKAKVPPQKGLKKKLRIAVPTPAQQLQVQLLDLSHYCFVVPQMKQPNVRKRMVTISAFVTPNYAISKKNLQLFNWCQTGFSLV